MAITYSTEQTHFVLAGKRAVTQWIKQAVAEEGFKVGDISIVFCDDPYLLEINRKYLQHDYHTDIITFDYSSESALSGDLMISIDTVKSNADEYGVMFHVELMRVIIHGIMHLAGYKDKEEAAAVKMREREDHYLETAPAAVATTMASAAAVSVAVPKS